MDTHAKPDALSEQAPRLDRHLLKASQQAAAARRRPGPVLVKRAATVELDWDVRQKSRFDATDSLGRALGVFLPRGTLVRGGDVLMAEDGSHGAGDCRAAGGAAHHGLRRARHAVRPAARRLPPGQPPCAA